MKRTTTLMAGLLATTFIAGAASADTIRFWTVEVQPERIAVQEEMIAGFEAATGHTVEIIPVEESDIQTRATAAFAAGDLPDVINLTVNHILP
jgi:multiple sugar transport system substrate-binding protein